LHCAFVNLLLSILVLSILIMWPDYCNHVSSRLLTNFFFQLLCITGYLGFVHCLSILKEFNIHRTGSVSILRGRIRGHLLSWLHQKELNSFTESADQTE
jgi:MFS superfamily sulfate permease-like transporter